MRKINPELWLLLFLVLIAAMLNFLVASQRMALVFYFLPTLFSAYHFGRRHATLTAVASVVLVVLLAFLNPAMFTRRVELPFDARWFDLTLWGGVLMIAGYATGTLYERNQKTLREMEDGYDGMLVILQNFLANQKHSDTQAYRISMCATKIAEAVGLDPGSVEDIRTAALLFNMKELGISNEVLCKAAQVSQEDLQQAMRTRSQEETKVQVLLLAEEYQALTSGERGASTKMSPAQAGQEVIKRAGTRYDSLVLNGFTAAFGGQAAGAGA